MPKKMQTRQQEKKINDHEDNQSEESGNKKEKKIKKTRRQEYMTKYLRGYMRKVNQDKREMAKAGNLEAINWVNNNNEKSRKWRANRKREETSQDAENRKKEAYVYRKKWDRKLSKKTLDGEKVTNRKMRNNQIKEARQWIKENATHDELERLKILRSQYRLACKNAKNDPSKVNILARSTACKNYEQALKEIREAIKERPSTVGAVKQEENVRQTRRQRNVNLGNSPVKEEQLYVSKKAKQQVKQQAKQQVKQEENVQQFGPQSALVAKQEEMIDVLNIPQQVPEFYQGFMPTSYDPSLMADFYNQGFMPTWQQNQNFQAKEEDLLQQIHRPQSANLNQNPVKVEEPYLVKKAQQGKNVNQSTKEVCGYRSLIQAEKGNAWNVQSNQGR